jgi:hypothetical protein
MELKDCKIGMIVIDKKDCDIGHIVGLSQNCTHEVIPVVKFSRHQVDKSYITVMNWHKVEDIRGEIRSIHPSNIEPLN